MQNSDLDTLKMVRELVSAIKTRVCGEKAPLWQDDYHTTFSRGVIADQCDYAIAAVATIIARMEQNTGSATIAPGAEETVSSANAGDASTCKDEENGHSPDASVCRLSPAPDVEVLLEKIEAERIIAGNEWKEGVNYGLDAAKVIIRAHFNAAAGEK